MQVAVLEEQRNEGAENEGAEKVEDEAKPIDADASAAEPSRKNESLDEKPDINDVPMEESQVNFCLSSLHVSVHILPCFRSIVYNKNCSIQSILGLHKLMKGHHFYS